MMPGLVSAVLARHHAGQLCWLVINFSPRLDPCTCRNISVLTGLSCSRSLYVMGGSFSRVLVTIAVAFHAYNALDSWA